jgi:transcriptional regulator of acetoin/glycerol metabolism
MSSLGFTSSHASRILNVVRGGLKPAGIDAHVTRSWYRCMKEYGIEPTAKRESAVLDPQTVREAQHRMGELLRVARAEMESLYDQIAGSGFAVILSDTQGAVMSTITDPTLQREFRQAGLWLGALWDEKHEGTNGIGTCLAEGCSVTVHREEHYRGYNVGLSCSGAPILDAHGSLLAVLDASSVNSNDSRLVQRHTMALVNMSANLISRWNFLNDFSHAWVLRFHSRPEFVGLLHEALIAVDGNGNILAVNESAMLQLGNSHRTAFVGQPVSNFFKFDFDTLEHRASHEPSTIWPVRDLAHGRRFFALVRAPLRAVMRAQALPAQDRHNEVVAPPGKLSQSAHVSEDALMRKNMICARQLFAKQVPILLQGATGTGKEAFAKTLHRHSLWADKPFVTVNCAAIPESLIESELFGYTRGTFTGAAKDGRPGKILQSSGGTLFLDEIGDMPLMLQTRLLRVIEEREVVPLGSDQGTPVDLHVISATHRDIRQMITAAAARPQRQGPTHQDAARRGKRKRFAADRRRRVPQTARLHLARQHPPAAQRAAHRVGSVPQRHDPAFQPAAGNPRSRHAANRHRRPGRHAIADFDAQRAAHARTVGSTEERRTRRTAARTRTHALEHQPHRAGAGHQPQHPVPQNP